MPLTYFFVSVFNNPAHFGAFLALSEGRVVRPIVAYMRPLRSVLRPCFFSLLRIEISVAPPVFLCLLRTYAH